MKNHTKDKIELEKEIRDRLKVILTENPSKSIDEILNELPESNDNQSAMDRLILVYAQTEEIEKLYQEHNENTNTSTNNTQD